jgi:hypothetical protein
MSEGLATQLAPLAIGVTVLCRGLCEPASGRVGEIGRNATARRKGLTRQARPRSWPPTSLNSDDQDSTRECRCSSPHGDPYPSGERRLAERIGRLI